MEISTKRRDDITNSMCLRIYSYFDSVELRRKIERKMLRCKKIPIVLVLPMTWKYETEKKDLEKITVVEVLKMIQDNKTKAEFLYLSQTYDFSCFENRPDKKLEDDDESESTFGSVVLYDSEKSTHIALFNLLR